MGRFSVEVKLANSIDTAIAEKGLISPDQVRKATAKGIVDTGATRLVIPEKIAQQLGVREVGEVQVRYADSRTATKKLVDDVLVEILGRQATFRATVEPDRDSVLIGAIVLEDLDFIVDPISETLKPRDPRFIISEIE